MKVIHKIKNGLLNINEKELGKMDFAVLAVILFLFFALIAMPIL